MTSKCETANPKASKPSVHSAAHPKGSSDRPASVARRRVLYALGAVAAIAGGGVLLLTTAPAMAAEVGG